MSQQQLRVRIGTWAWVSGALMAPALSLAAEAELSEVKVTAAAVDAQEERRTASAGKLIFDRQELASTNAATVGELLSKLPGAGMFSDAQGGPPRRGQGRGPNRNMPQILVDGQPMPGGNPASTFRLPVEMIERVEIIRNSTPEFPVSSPAGVINIVLRDVPPKAMRNLKLTLNSQDGEAGAALDGQLSNTQGALGYLLSGSVSSRPTVGSRDSVITTYTGGVAAESREQTEQAGEDRNVTFSPRLNWKPAAGGQVTLSPFVSVSDEQRTVQTRRTNSATVLEREAQDGERQTARLMGEWKKQGAQGTEMSVRVMAQAEDEDTVRMTELRDNTGALTFRQEQTATREQEQSLETRGKTVLADAHLLTGALEWRNKTSDDAQTRQGVRTTSAVDEQRLVVWLQDEWQISERHLLTPGFRWQTLESTLSDSQNGQQDNNQTTRAPSLHYLWQPNPVWNLRASIARTDRPVSGRDLNPAVRTANGLNDSGNPDRAGNPQLAAEKQQSLELGVEHFLADKTGSVGLSVYERRTDDYVQRLTLLESGRWVERPYNVGDSRIRGLVFDAKARLAMLDLPDLTVRANAAYSDVAMLSRHANLGAGEGPRQSVNLGAEYEWRAYKLTLGGSLGYTSALDRESSATVIQEQGSQEQAVVYALYKPDRQTSIRFAVHNLTAADREESLREYDATGALTRTEADRINGLASASLSVEKRW